MTTPLNENATLRDLLFDEATDQPVDALAQMLSEHGTIANVLPLGLTDLGRHELADATAGLMSVNLADVVATGWKKYDALKQAARRTRDDPDTKEFVTLVTHKIESSYDPNVQLFLDGALIATIEINLELTLTIAAVIAVVRQGRLTEIQSGSCTASGSLTVQTVEIIKRQRKFNLYGAIQLGHGVALLEPATSNEPVERQVVVHNAKTPTTPGAWHPDPTKRYESRWWDGSRWTQHVATRGRTMSDPLVSEPDSDVMTGTPALHQ